MLCIYRVEPRTLYMLLHRGQPAIFLHSLLPDLNNGILCQYCFIMIFNASVFLSKSSSNRTFPQPMTLLERMR